MKEVLIINLTRMGDLIQTTPVMAGLKEKHPGVRITLLVSSAFLEICRFIPFIDRLIVFDIKGFLDELSSGNHNLVKSFRYIEDIVEKINEVDYDLALNFTHSTDSAILLSMIKAKETRGIGIDDEGYSVKRHPWIRYFFNVIPGRDYNPFHLCDMHIKVSGAMPQKRGLHLNLTDDINICAKTILEKEGIKDTDHIIGLQLGASAEDKQWHVKSFANLADRLTEAFGVKILLTGTSEERSFGEEFETIAKTKPLNLIGKTNINELVGLLNRCNLFISNDTGPLHIATALGITTINISLASVHFRETGPYGEGHYVITPDIPCYPCGFRTDCKNRICKDTIDVDKVFILVENILKGKPFEEIKDSDLWKGVQVYKSYFDDHGFIDYRPLIKRTLNKEGFFSEIYRNTWLMILDRAELNHMDKIYQYIKRKFQEWYIYNPSNIGTMIEEEFNTLLKLKSLADTGLTKVSHIASEAKKPSPDIKWIKDTWTDVPIIEEEIEIIGHTHPALKPLSILFRYEKEALEGTHLTSLSEETSNIYIDLRNHVIIILQLIERFKNDNTKSNFLESLDYH